MSFAFSAMLLAAVVSSRSLEEKLAPIFEKVWIPYGPISWINTLVFGSGNDERGILFVIVTTWFLGVRKRAGN